METRKQLLRPLLISFAGSALVIWLYLGGEAIEAAISAKAGRELIIAAIWSHVGWGVVMTPLLIAYAFMRAVALRASHSTEHFAVRAGALASWALIAVLVFLVVTGPIVVWTYGSDLKVFDWFAVPTPTGKLPVIHEPLEAAHKWVAKAAPWLAGLDAMLAGRAFWRR